MDSNAPSPRRLLYLAGLTTLLFCGAIVWSMALLLLAVATTPGGRWTAAAFVLALPALGTAPFAWSHRRREPLMAALGVLLALGGLAFGRAMHIAPAASDDPSTPLRSVYLGEGAHLRTGLANLVPEVDQFTLGSYLMGSIDPFLDREQSRRVRGLFQTVYGEMAQDPSFAATGSAMGWSYRELFGRRWNVGHHYVYRPPGSGDEPLPVLIFLHGWGGPFQGYQWVFRRFAEERGYAVVAPSFGMGWWRQRQALPALERSLAWIDEQPDLDGDRLILAGLSNGGPGVQRAALAYPDRWDGVVFLNAVMDGDQVLRMSRTLAEREVPILVVTGDAERRIPVDFTRTWVATMAIDHDRVQLEVYPGEDHFLLFSQPGAVMDLLGRWVETEIRAAGRPAGTPPPPDPGA
jgi:pimeloyl-ACP methyl ester carboxylesterase